MYEISKSSYRIVFWLVLAVALFLRLGTSYFIPLGAAAKDPNCAPDEAWHFEVAQALSQGQVLKWPEETSAIYAIYPPSQYMFQAASFALLKSHLDTHLLYRYVWANSTGTPDNSYSKFQGYPFARLGSALLGVFTVVFMMGAAQAWTRSRLAVVVAGVTTAIFPQFVFIGSYVNGDAITIAAGAALAWTLAAWVRRGEGDSGLPWIGCALGGVLLGKMSGFFVIPPTLLWIFWAFLQGRISRRVLINAVALMVVVSAPVLVWNAVRNQGDFLGFGLYNRFLKEVWHGKVAGEIVDAPWVFFRQMVTSSFGKFGNMNIPLPFGFFILAWGLCGIGLTVGYFLNRPIDSVSLRGTGWLLGVALLALGLQVYNCWFVDFSPQGRYSLLVPLLLFALAAWIPIQGCASHTRYLWLVLFLGFLVVAEGRSFRLIQSHPCIG